MNTPEPTGRPGRPTDARWTRSGESRAGAAARVARHPRRVADDAALLVEESQRPFHGDRLEAPHSIAVVVVEESDQQDRRGHDGDDGSDQRRLDDRTLSAVGEEEHE